MVNFGPLTAEIGLPVWGTPANFNGFRVLTSFTAATSFTGGQPNFARCLAVSCAATQYVSLYIFGGGFCPLTEFCQVEDLRSTSYIGSVISRHSTVQQRASAKLCGMVQRIELRKFRRRRNLHSAGRPSRWASAHILVVFLFVR